MTTAIMVRDVNGNTLTKFDADLGINHPGEIESVMEAHGDGALIVVTIALGEQETGEG